MHQRSATGRVSLLLAWLMMVGCDQSSGPIAPDPNEISFLRELGGDAQQFERACDPREFEFPADHLAHPSFRNEWWYLTGNLRSDAGVQLGFQVTFFRIANTVGADKLDSAWQAEQFYMGHFALSEFGRPAVRAHEKFVRAAAGLAGATPDPTRIWMEDWQLVQSADHPNQWSVSVGEGADAISLSLQQAKPLVLQGQGGLSQKSAERCNSSYYYSLTRLNATGEVVVDQQTHQVSGSAWLDREWSSSALADDQAGWDWFALQLDDGRDLMYYRLRDKSGQSDPQSYAVLVGVDGEKTRIDTAGIEYRVDKWWQSDSGARYPVAGQLDFDEVGVSVVYEPLIENQELALTVRYWEGAIVLKDIAGERIGRGYLELTGY